MKAFRLRILILAAIVATACQYATGKKELKDSNPGDTLTTRHKGSPAGQTGQKFEIANVLDTSGKQVTLNFNAPGITLIDFWNNECPPCINEMKAFPALINGKEKTIRVFSISLNQFNFWKKDFAAGNKRFSFLQSPVSNWKHYVLGSSDDPAWHNEISIDRLTELSEKYGFNSFPAYFVINNEGIITGRPESAVAFLEKYLQ